MRTQLCIASIVLMLPSCFISRSVVNEPIDPASVAKLTPGTTTADEALALLGAPSEVVQLGKRSAWRYDHAQDKSTGLWLIVVGMLNDDTQADRVWLFFDENEVLKHAGATLTAHTAAYAMPWELKHD